MYLEYFEQPLGSREQNLKNMPKPQQVISKLLCFRKGVPCILLLRMVKGKGMEGVGEERGEEEKMREKR